jgi:hypothetical protein
VGKLLKAFGGQPFKTLVHSLLDSLSCAHFSFTFPDVFISTDYSIESQPGQLTRPWPRINRAGGFLCCQTRGNMIYCTCDGPEGRLGDMIARLSEVGVTCVKQYVKGACHQSAMQMWSTPVQVLQGREGALDQVLPGRDQRGPRGSLRDANRLTPHLSCLRQADRRRQNDTRASCRKDQPGHCATNKDVESAIRSQQNAHSI